MAKDEGFAGVPVERQGFAGRPDPSSPVTKPEEQKVCPLCRGQGAVPSYLDGRIVDCPYCEGAGASPPQGRPPAQAREVGNVLTRCFIVFRQGDGFPELDPLRLDGYAIVPIEDYAHYVEAAQRHEELLYPRPETVEHGGRLMSRECCSYNQPQSHQTRPSVVVRPPWGTKTVCLDACIAASIQLLWEAGIETRGSCCGHGTASPSVVLRDGAGDNEMQAAHDLLTARDGRSWGVFSWRLVEYVPSPTEE